MVKQNARMRILVLAAYLLTALLPALVLAQAGRQSAVARDQMVAMAGHLAHIPATGSPVDETRQLLCQQHCLFAAAALPVPSDAFNAAARLADAKVAVDILPASLAIPPPGRPPKSS